MFALLLVPLGAAFAADDGGFSCSDGAIAMLSKQVAHALGKGEAGFQRKPATRLERNRCPLHQLAIGTQGVGLGYKQGTLRFIAANLGLEHVPFVRQHIGWVRQDNIDAGGSQRGEPICLKE